MKMFTKIVGLSLCLAIVSVSAFAGGWQTFTKVKHYLVEGDDRAYVVFEASFNPDNCANPRYIRINPQTPRGANLLKMVIAAKVSNQEVKPLLGGCDDWDRPMLKGLWVR